MRRDTPTGEGTLISHLLELRDRLLRAILAVVVIFVCLVPFANDLYEILAKPLMSALPEGNSMISTEPHGPFFVPFKFAFACAFAIAVPYVLYQMWAFVAPGLYQHEKRMVLPIIVSSSLLFYLGIVFAYFVVFPIIFAFFAGSAPEGVQVMTDINAYFSFVVKLFFAFGVAFEVPCGDHHFRQTGHHDTGRPGDEASLHHHHCVRGGDADDPAGHLLPDATRGARMAVV